MSWIKRTMREMRTRNPDHARMEAVESDSGGVYCRRPHWPDGITIFARAPLSSSRQVEPGQPIDVGYLKGDRNLPQVLGRRVFFGVRKAGGTPPTLFYGLWDCPEGAPWINYCSGVAQQPLSWGGTEVLSESLDRHDGGGTFDYSSQKTRTDPTGLVRYNVGDEQFLAAVWGKYWSTGERRGNFYFRQRNLSTGSWVQSPLFLARQIARQDGPAGDPFLPARREGNLFHCQASTGAHFLFVVYPGSSSIYFGDPTPNGGAFAVLPHASPASGTLYTLTPDPILDRPREDPDVMPRDPETGKLYGPIDRSGGVAVANMSLLECYWSGWRKAEDGIPADSSSTDRAVLHLYKIDPATGAMSTYNKSLRVILGDAFGGGDDLYRIMSCGIFDPSSVVYDFDNDGSQSTVAPNYQLQMPATRWPYHTANASFWFDVSVQIRTSGGALVPKALTAEIKTADGAVNLLGEPRVPDQSIRERYAGFVVDEMARLESLLLPFDYGGDYMSIPRDTGVVQMFLSYETETCAPRPTNPDENGNYPPPPNWIASALRANNVEDFWAGLDQAYADAVAADPVQGEILLFPGIKGTAEDNQGENSGQCPAGTIVGGKKYSFEARPQRYVTSCESIANPSYDGPVAYPDGTEETKSWPTYDDWDPDHLIADWFRFAECWIPIGPTVVKYHTSMAIQGRYDDIEIHHRSYLVVHDGSNHVDVDVTAYVNLTGVRFDNFPMLLDIFQWAIAGEVLFVLRDLPGDGAESYVDEAAARAACVPHLELRSVADPETILTRRSLRPATGDLWDPVRNYPPHFLCNVNSTGKPWAHVWTEWQGPGDSHPRHGSSQCVWADDDLTVTEEVSSATEKPENRASLPDSTVTVAADNRAYWFDDCKAIKAIDI